MTAHNLLIKEMIIALKRMKCEYVDATVVDELTLTFKPSEHQGDEEEETDVKDIIV